MAIRIDRVVTRGGDGGQTSLGTGERVSKAAPRIEAIGAVDEANAAIGVLRLHTRDRPEEDAMLARIQNDLFDLGADLCVPPPENGPDERLRVSAESAGRLEAEVAAMNETLPPLTSFVPARRHDSRRLRPCGTNSRTPGRARDRDAGRCRGGQSLGGPAAQSTVGPSLRSQPGTECWLRIGGCLGSGLQPKVVITASRGSSRAMGKWL